MNRAHSNATLAASLAAALLAAGCGPDYPNCDNDEDCHEGEFCVNGQCQQCRDNSDCAPDQQCTGGRCEDNPGYCSTNADCPAGQECRDHACVSREGYCTTNADCPDGQECQNNVCVAATTAGACDLGTIYFEFDSSELSSTARDTLQQNVSCIRERSLNAVQVVGHTDPRGTEEYNLALGDRRAQSVVRYLQSLGVAGNALNASSMGEEMANGADESGWSHDRRVEMQPR
jgi:peptidoglycan-associated lipoprotein